MLASAPTTDTAEALEHALLVIDRNLVTFADCFPDDATVNNIYRPRQARESFSEGGNFDWTPAFWSGMLWLAYELTGEARYRELGERHIADFSRRLAEQVDIDTHDLGFLYTLSCVAPWRLLGHAQARATALAAARHLMTRYWPKAGIIQAWGDVADPSSQGQAIIDSLLNTPLLYWASEQSGDPSFAQAAHSHALRLSEHIVRPDATTYHTFFFDPITGAPRYGSTHQGYADDSCWARGQAWGIYGFALNHHYTGDERLLRVAERVADYFLAHLPADNVVYWDLVFGDGSDEERDSSAAAIAVCGLFELATALPEGAARTRYHEAARTILGALIEHYTSRARPASNALLLHSVYSKPRQDGVDEGCLWGDYFYLEALVRATRPAWQRYW